MNGKKNPLQFFLRWEFLLAALIVIVYMIFNSQMPSNYTIPKLINQTRVYMVDVGFMSLGMLLILIMGDMDISIASIASLSCTIMGVSYSAGVPFPISICLALMVGAACGMINGLLVTRFKELFPMIITLSTQTLFRGISYIILKDQSSGGFPDWFSTNLGYGMANVFGVEVPVMLFCLLAVIPFYYFWLHKSSSGRRIFATGTNIQTAFYSGLNTDNVKTLMFIINGILAAIGGIFLTARTGSVKYTMAPGYEMQAIAIVVLAGASTAGGKGSVIGLLLALILMTCLKNGLMLMYNDAFILNLSIGLLLIGIVFIPNMFGMLQQYRRIKQRRKDAINIG